MGVDTFNKLGYPQVPPAPQRAAAPGINSQIAQALPGNFTPVGQATSDNFDGGMKNWQTKSPYGQEVGELSPLLGQAGLGGSTLQDLSGYSTNIHQTNGPGWDTNTESLVNPTGKTVSSVDYAVHPSWTHDQWGDLAKFALGAASGAYSGMNGASSASAGSQAATDAVYQGADTGLSTQLSSNALTSATTMPDFQAMQTGTQSGEFGAQADFPVEPQGSLNDQIAQNLPQNPDAIGTLPSSQPASPLGSSDIAPTGGEIANQTLPNLPTTATTDFTPPATGLDAVAGFAKDNPLLTASTAGAVLNKINSPGDPPSMANPTTGASADTTALTTALEQKLYGPNAAQPDYSKVPALQTNAGDTSQYYQQAADAMYDKQKQYLDPQVAQQQQALEARLAEQGFVPGTPGYNQAMQNFQDTNARAYAAARDSAIGQGITAGQNIFTNSMGNAQLNNTASNSTLQQILAERSQPFNEYSTLRTGNQIDAKQQYAADLGNYNAQVSSSNSTNQALGSLATALGIYYSNNPNNPLYSSDARLKEDIIPIGRTPGGANLYEYTIFGRREIGVMAQELQITQPDAVMVDPASGYLLVDYRKVR